jgi:transposase
MFPMLPSPPSPTFSNHSDEELPNSNRDLELTRIGRHPEALLLTCRYAQILERLPSGVPAANGGVGAAGPQAGRSVAQFGPTAQAIATWVRPAERDAGKRQDGPTRVERKELTRLRRENHRLRQERDIATNACPRLDRGGGQVRAGSSSGGYR